MDLTFATSISSPVSQTPGLRATASGLEYDHEVFEFDVDNEKPMADTWLLAHFQERRFSRIIASDCALHNGVATTWGVDWYRGKGPDRSLTWSCAWHDGMTTAWLLAWHGGRRLSWSLAWCGAWHNLMLGFWLSMEEDDPVRTSLGVILG